MILLIAYDLHPSPGRDYQPIEDAIKSYGLWAHLEGSVWAIDTLDAPRAVLGQLQAIGHAGDTFFVGRLHQNWWSSGLSGAILTWMQDPARRW